MQPVGTSSAEQHVNPTSSPEFILVCILYNLFRLFFFVNPTSSPVLWYWFIVHMCTVFLFIFDCFFAHPLFIFTFFFSSVSPSLKVTQIMV